ncbi:MAG: pentapeptide repeat-containing protein [Bacteroidota bacterium]
MTTSFEVILLIILLLFLPFLLGVIGKCVVNIHIWLTNKVNPNVNDTKKEFIRFDITNKSNQSKFGKLSRKSNEYFIGSTIQTFIYLFVSTCLIVGFIDYKVGFFDNESNIIGVLTEAHGMILDIFILGFIYTFYENSRAKREKIELLNEQLSDYNLWSGEEANTKKRIIIKQLNSLGITRVYTNRQQLENSNLSNLDLSYSSLTLSNFDNANLRDTNLAYTNLVGSSLKTRELWNTNLLYCSLFRVAVYVDFFEVIKTCNVIGWEYVTNIYEIHSAKGADEGRLYYKDPTMNSIIPKRSDYERK